MPTQHFKKRVKRILYTLYKKANRELWEFNLGTVFRHYNSLSNVFKQAV
jgi:hypothetical protein